MLCWVGNSSMEPHRLTCCYTATSLLSGTSRHFQPCWLVYLSDKKKCFRHIQQNSRKIQAVRSWGRPLVHHSAVNRNSSEQLLKAPSHWGISGSSDGNHWIVFQGDASYDINSPTVSLKLPCQHFSELTEITGIDLTYLNFLPQCDSLQK